MIISINDRLVHVWACLSHTPVILNVMRFWEGGVCYLFYTMTVGDVM